MSSTKFEPSAESELISTPSAPASSEEKRDPRIQRIVRHCYRFRGIGARQAKSYNESARVNGRPKQQLIGTLAVDVKTIDLCEEQIQEWLALRKLEYVDTLSMLRASRVRIGADGLLVERNLESDDCQTELRTDWLYKRLLVRCFSMTEIRQIVEAYEHAVGIRYVKVGGSGRDFGVPPTRKQLLLKKFRFSSRRGKGCCARIDFDGVPFFWIAERHLGCNCPTLLRNGKLRLTGNNYCGADGAWVSSEIGMGEDDAGTSTSIDREMLSLRHSTGKGQKLACSATIWMTQMLRFPQYNLRDDTIKGRKFAASLAKREFANEGIDQLIQQCFVLQLPAVCEHAFAGSQRVEEMGDSKISRALSSTSHWWTQFNVHPVVCEFIRLRVTVDNLRDIRVIRKRIRDQVRVKGSSGGLNKVSTDPYYYPTAATIAEIIDKVVSSSKRLRLAETSGNPPTNSERSKAHSQSQVSNKRGKEQWTIKKVNETERNAEIETVTVSDSDAMPFDVYAYAHDDVRGQEVYVDSKTYAEASNSSWQMPTTSEMEVEADADDDVRIENVEVAADVQLYSESDALA